MAGYLFDGLLEAELKLVDYILRASAECHEFEQLILEEGDDADDVMVVPLLLLASGETREYTHPLRQYIMDAEQHNGTCGGLLENSSVSNKVGSLDPLRAVVGQ